MRHFYDMNKTIFGLSMGAMALLLSACGAVAGAATDTRAVAVTRGSLSATVNATGNVQPNDEVKLGFASTGMIAVVNVKVGDAVKKGDVLASLDVSETEIALAKAKLSIKNAETALVIASTNVSKTLEGPRAPDIAAAQASIGAAQAAYDKAKTGPKPSDYAGAQARVRNAEAALKRAQSGYDQAYTVDPATITAHPAALQLEQATNDLAAAQAELERAAQPADAADIRAAQQRMAEARANLDKIKLPARDHDVERARAERAQAELQIEQARLDAQGIERKLAQARIVAPMDGVIAAVDFKAGEPVSAASLLTLVDTSQLITDINVDEIDVAKVKTGQDVSVRLDSLPGSEIAGKITLIAPTSKIVNGVVSYAVRVAIPAGEAALRPGMSANTRIVLEKRDNVLLVPTWAIRKEKATGKTFITLKAASSEAKPEEVEVKLGLADDTNTEIVSGLTEGQSVIEPQPTATPAAQ